MEVTLSSAVMATTEPQGPKLIGSLGVTQVVQLWPKATAHHLTVEPGASFQVNVGSIDGIRLLYLETTGALQVRTDAADGSVQTVAPPSSAAKGVLLKTGSCAGLWVENTGAQAVEASVLVAGVES